ncbi:MAG TPA: hypothetical protein VFF69_07955 [Phycisphaerales bacterium]|nr:hypothetical protein [Phycisphaerales bacterium]
MKRSTLLAMTAGLLLGATAASAQTPWMHSFTYQGQVRHNGAPVTGQVDLELQLWDSASGGQKIGASRLYSVAAAEGLFAVEFDPQQEDSFADGNARWLEVRVRYPDGGTGWETLPRQKLTAAPYSLATRGINMSKEGSATFIKNISLGGDLTASGWVRCKVLQITGGSDIAEPYTIAPAGDVAPAPGMVVTIDPENIGRLRVAAGEYDRTVAGIISGANGVNPGITLTQTGTVADGELPVATVGRVWCWCDADSAGPVRPGDLLTTSPTPGHAMRVAEHDRSQGAVIGKAMSGLESGRGMVLVLVGLQ